MPTPPQAKFSVKCLGLPGGGGMVTLGNDWHITNAFDDSNLSQETYAIDTWRNVKTLWDMVANTWLQSFRGLYGDQASYRNTASSISSLSET